MPPKELSPDHILADIFSFLDVTARLQAARACKAFWRLIFTSHRCSIWRITQLPSDVAKLEKIRPVLVANGDVVWSLFWFDEQLITEEVLEQLPVMPDLRHLSLGRCSEKFSANHSTIVDRGMIHAWAAKFPGLSSLRALKSHFVWDLTMVQAARAAWPLLNTFEACLVNCHDITVPELKNLLDKFSGLEIVRFESIDINSGSVELFDRLATSNVGKGLQVIHLVCDRARNGSFAPKTNLRGFESLECLEISDHNTGVWLNTSLPSAFPKLKKLQLCDCFGLAQIRNGLSASRLTNITIFNGKGHDAEFIRRLPPTLKNLTIHQQRPNFFEFKVSAGILALANAGSVEKIDIKGEISSLHNTVDEMDILYQNIMNHPESFAKMKKLSVDLTLVSSVGYDTILMRNLDEIEFEELKRRLPSGFVLEIGPMFDLLQIFGTGRTANA